MSQLCDSCQISITIVDDSHCRWSFWLLIFVIWCDELCCQSGFFEISKMWYILHQYWHDKYIIVALLFCIKIFFLTIFILPLVFILRLTDFLKLHYWLQCQFMDAGRLKQNFNLPGHFFRLLYYGETSHSTSQAFSIKFSL